jgi:hypothetical protein
MKNTIWQTPSGIAITTYSDEPVPIKLDGSGGSIEATALTSSQKAVADQASGVIPSDWIALGHDVAVTPEQFASLESLAWVDGGLAVDAAVAFNLLARKAEAAAQRLLDGGAAAWGFDSLVSAASYLTSKNTQRKADAVALVGWRDDLWDASSALKSAVIAGTEPAPASISAFLAALPAQPSRPVV